MTVEKGIFKTTLGEEALEEGALDISVSIHAQHHFKPFLMLIFNELRQGRQKLLYGIYFFVGKEAFVLVPNRMTRAWIVTWNVSRNKGSALFLLSYSLPRPSSEARGILAFTDDVCNCFTVDRGQNSAKLNGVSSLVIQVERFAGGQSGFKKLGAIFPIIVRF